MGSAYQDSERLKQVLGELARQMLGQGENRDRFAVGGMTVKFSITDPDCVVYLDPRDPQTVRLDDDSEADITLSMTADFMHDFWLGKVNIIESLGKGEMVITAGAQVPAVKSVDLLPLLLPGLEIYPGLL